MIRKNCKCYLPAVKNTPERMNNNAKMISSAGVKSPNDLEGQNGELTPINGTMDISVKRMDPYTNSHDPATRSFELKTGSHLKHLSNHFVR